MKGFVLSFLGFLLALSLVLTAYVWFDGQRVTLHKTGRVTPLYCGVMRALDYPRFEQGQRWRCEMILEPQEPVIMDQDSTIF